MTLTTICKRASAGLIAFLIPPLLGSTALAATPAPANAVLYLISPADGATVDSPLTIRFGLKGMGVAPAGVEKKDTGHHHLLIDTSLPELGKPVPVDDKHRHFGAGQTEVTIPLAPGKHTLQLLLGDHNHIAHDPPVMSQPVSITVR